MSKTDERTAFEAWAVSEDAELSITKIRNEHLNIEAYGSNETWRAWQAWCARASMQAEAPATPEQLYRKVAVYSGLGQQTTAYEPVATPERAAPGGQGLEQVIQDFAAWAKPHLDPSYIQHWVTKLRAALQAEPRNQAK